MLVIWPVILPYLSNSPAGKKKIACLEKPQRRASGARKKFAGCDAKAVNRGRMDV